MRDLIPERIRSSGRNPVVRTASDAEFAGALRTKLQEEVVEFLESGEIEELVDILEVLHALADCEGLRPEDLEQHRARKAAERGAFTRRLILHTDSE